MVLRAEGYVEEVRPLMVPITKIEPFKEGKDKKFMVRTEHGEFKLDKVGASPRFLITYKEQAVATAAQYYTILSHDEVGRVIGEALRAEELDAVAVDEKQCRPWQRRWTAVVHRDMDVRETTMGRYEKWDAGFGVTNSYDLSLALNTSIYGFRMACKNGLYLPGWQRLDQLKHVDAENDPHRLIQRLLDNVREAIRASTDIDKIMEPFLDRTPHVAQVLEIGRRLGVRKYESRILDDRGIHYLFEKGKSLPIDVRIESKIMNEIDLINSFTSMANSVNTVSRMMDIQSRIGELVISTRGYGEPRIAAANTVMVRQ